ncbi:MAG TPA: bifunctional diguanylate cyclase/phosphodiesterase [Gammaproteobacteria bacterium]|nr:bifunctional diguanylate cyclase/phosphodiesterase [Gammaproteobacteria bacterium]
MKFRLSVKQYALLISLLTLVLLLVFGWISLQELEKTEKEIVSWQSDLSRQELERSLQKLQEKSLQVASAFAGWQEVRQQLENPEYYSYWKLHRARSAPMLPDDVIDVAVYDSHGRMLSRLPGQTLIEQLPETLPAPCVTTRAGGESVLTAFSPVKRPVSGEFMGYVAVQFSLKSLLKKMGHFSFIDDASLHLEVPEDREVPLTESIDFFSYEFKQDVIWRAIDRFIKKAGQHLLLIGVILSLVLYVYLAHIVAAPISLLIGHIKKLREDENMKPEALIQPLAVKELDEIRVLLNRYHARLDDIHRDLDRTNKELWELAHHDPLTGILNRRAFNDYWENVLKRGEPVSLMIIDINHFKALNDSYGHRTGDSVLKGVVDCLTGVVCNAEQLFRLGGDEFACVLTGSDGAALQEVATGIRQAVDEHDFSVLGISEPVKVSIGIAIAPQIDQLSVTGLIRQADIAIYQAKRPGSAGIVVYSESLGDMKQDLFSSKTYNAVYKAIEHGHGLHMFYQPIVSLEDNRICYYEALLRIRHNDEWIYPDSIFPIIEARNLEQDLDRAVIRQVASDLAAGRLPENTGVAINLSAASVARQDVDDWFEPLEPYLSSQNMVIEVTETALITQLERATENLEKLSRKGFRVALDDFGSGYSSIRYLSCMPVNIVKFDISLIRDLDNDEQQPIITGLSRIISGLGYSMVAEGIEDVTMRDNAIAAGFEYAQGYLFGRPEQEPVVSVRVED